MNQIFLFCCHSLPFMFHILYIPLKLIIGILLIKKKKIIGIPNMPTLYVYSNFSILNHFSNRKLRPFFSIRS